VSKKLGTGSNEQTPEAVQEVLRLTAWQQADAVRCGRLSAREICVAYFAQIDATRDLNAYLRLCPERAFAEADAVDAGDRTGLLAGVAVGLKDNFVTAGLETCCASKILAGWIPPFQGTHAQRLASAGAVCLGKLSMDEFGMGTTNEYSAYGAVLNPWSLRHAPGGSSGGSAAAVAARSCAFALGSDTGGSIRQPASFTNLVGLKPTYGRVSRHGLIAFASSFDQAGTLTRDVRDAALALQVLAGRDTKDSCSLDAHVPDYLAASRLGVDQGLKGTRVGVHRSGLDREDLDLDVRAAFSRSLQRLEARGATLVDIDLPHFEHAVATYCILATAEASSNLARFDGVRYGVRESGNDVLEMVRNTRTKGFGDEVKRRILLGTFVLRADTYEDYMARAMKVRTLIARDYSRAFLGCDVIASPVCPVPGIALGDTRDDPLKAYQSDIFTLGANLAGLPALSIPSGFSSPNRADSGLGSLPIGLQLIAPRLAEESLFVVAGAHEIDCEAQGRCPPHAGLVSPKTQGLDAPEAGGHR